MEIRVMGSADEAARMLALGDGPRGTEAWAFPVGDAGEAVGVTVRRDREGLHVTRGGAFSALEHAVEWCQVRQWSEIAFGEEA